MTGLLGLRCSAFTSASHKLNCARKLLNACEKPSDPIPASNLQKPGLFSINLDSRKTAGAFHFAIFIFQFSMLSSARRDFIPAAVGFGFCAASSNPARRNAQG